MKKGLKWTLIAFAVIVAIGLFSNGDEDMNNISANTVDYEWPLTVESGSLLCEPPSAVVFEAPDGTQYAVNGSASSLQDQRGYEELEAIWRDDPEVPGLKISVGGLISDGLEICE